MAIKQLSRQLANQIAAGEVVENPASVVKELLENAVDAHATSITLELHAAGKNYIKVSDNGQGIPRDELPLALAPHATSKISTVDDLAAIMTLGFRGEALASIAAVSKLTLTSNTAGQSNGFQVEVAGADQHPLIAPAAHPIGTSVVVRELFFNTPARRRFLKSDRYEFNKVRDIFVRIALVNYGIEFKLFNEGKLVIHAPATDKAGIAQRIVRLLGNDFRQDIINVDNHDPVFQLAMQRVYEADAFGMSVDFRAHPVDASSTSNLLEPPHQPVLGIHGILLRPQVARRAVPDKVVFFLNGRCMGDKLVLRAIREGFLQALNAKHNLKPSVRGVLFMDCDPHIVDVNVHPRKDEVRFHNSNVIFDCISTTIKTALLLQGVTAQSLGQGSLQLEFDADETTQGDEQGEAQPLFRDSPTGGNNALGEAAPVTASAATARMFPDGESCATLTNATTTTTATPTTTAMGTTNGRDMTRARGEALSGRGASRGMGTISEDNDGAKRAWAADSALSLQGAGQGTADPQALAAASFTRGEQRVERLRQTVEQYLQKTQHGVFSSAKTWAQPTMRGALTDFTQLKAGWAEMEVQRQAQQAVRDELINPQAGTPAQFAPAPATTPADAGFAAQTAEQGQEQLIANAAQSAQTQFETPAPFGASVQLGATVLQNQPSELELQGLQGRQGQSQHREMAQSASNSAWASRLSARLSQQEQQRSAEHWQQGAGAVQGAVAAEAADTAQAATYGQRGFVSTAGQSLSSQQSAQGESAATRDWGEESPDLGSNPNPNSNPEGAFTHKSIGAEQGADAAYAAAAASEDDDDESEEQREFGRQVVDKANLLAQNIKLLKKARLARLSPFERQQYQLGLGQEESAQFLSLVAPNVLLFALRHRYFLAKGSDILTGCLASDYQEQVHEDEVLSYDLGIPFSFAAAKELLAAFKKEEVRTAARRCGFALQAQPARGMIAIMRAPLLLQGVNLAQVLPRALHLVAAGTNSINGQAGLASGFASLDSLVEADDKQRAEAQAQGNVAVTQVTPTFTLVASYVTPEQGGGAIGINGSHCPQQLALLLAGMRECEINTEMDARTLLAQLFRLEQLRPLLDRGLLQELNLAQLAQQMVSYKA